MVFDSMTIWVQMHNLLVAFMNKKVLEVLGAKISKVNDVHLREGAIFWGGLLELGFH